MSEPANIFTTALRVERRARRMTLVAVQCAITAALLITPAAATVLGATATLLTFDGAVVHAYVSTLGRPLGLTLVVVASGLLGASLAHRLYVDRLNRRIGWGQ